MAISKGQLSQSVNSRLASCKLIGEIAPKFEHFWIKKELMALVTSLCQDVDYEVRACMCKQLEPVAKALGYVSTAHVAISGTRYLYHIRQSFFYTILCRYCT